MSRRGQEERKEGGREGVFRIVIGAVEVISDLKSSRCGPAPEKGREAESRREIKREGGVLIRLCPSV